MAGPGNATANALNGASAASAIQQYNQAANVGITDDTLAINPLSVAEAGVALAGAAVLIGVEEIYDALGGSYAPGAASVLSQTASSDNGQGSDSANFQVVSSDSSWNKEIFDLPLPESLGSGLGYGAVYMARPRQSNGDGGTSEPEKERNTDTVPNLKELYKRPGFGQRLGNNSRPVKGTKNFVATANITNDSGEVVIKEGHTFYIDQESSNHLEVYDKRMKASPVVNIDGTVNLKKSKAAEGRTIKR